MKKLALIFAGLSLMVATGCKDDETQQVFPIVGTWKPVKEVRTEIDVNGAGFSDEIVYTPCQQDSRWVFNEASTGKRVDNDFVGATTPVCSVINTRNFSYIYNSGDQNFEIKYAGTVVPEKGKVVLLDAQTLNLKIEDRTDPNLYISKTYTFKRIVQ